MSSMSRDSRGISRGKCNLPECNCQSYMGGSDGMKCVGCGHPPGKHQNLTSPGAGSSSAAYTGGGYPTNYPSAAGSVSGYQPSWTSPGYQAYGQSVPSSHAVGGFSRGYPSSSSHQTWSNTCQADGCMNSRHYEHGAGWFDYCSPACRDRHLLPIETKRLHDDLKMLTEISSRLHIGYQASGSVSTVGNYNGRQDTRYKLTASTTPTGSAFTASHSGHQQAGKLKTVNWYKSSRDFGVIFNEELYDARDVKGYLVTGAKLGTYGSEKLTWGDLRLLDVVVKMNDRDATIHGKPSVFKERLKDEKSLNLVLNRTISLPCPDKLLRKASTSYSTHVFALQNAGTSKDDFGLTTDKTGKMVEGISKDTPARKCGLQFNDEIVYCAPCTQDKMDTFQSTLKNDDIDRAAKQGQSIIIVVRRK